MVISTEASHRGIEKMKLKVYFLVKFRSDFNSDLIFFLICPIVTVESMEHLLFWLWCGLKDALKFDAHLSTFT